MHSPLLSPIPSSGSQSIAAQQNKSGPPCCRILNLTAKTMRATGLGAIGVGVAVAFGSLGLAAPLAAFFFAAGLVLLALSFYFSRLDQADLTHKVPRDDHLQTNNDLDGCTLETAHKDHRQERSRRCPELSTTNHPAQNSQPYVASQSSRAPPKPDVRGQEQQSLTDQSYPKAFRIEVPASPAVTATASPVLTGDQGGMTAEEVLKKRSYKRLYRSSSSQFLPSSPIPEEPPQTYADLEDSCVLIEQVIKKSILKPASGDGTPHKTKASGGAKGIVFSENSKNILIETRTDLRALGMYSTDKRSDAEYDAIWDKREEADPEETVATKEEDGEYREGQWKSAIRENDVAIS